MNSNFIKSFDSDPSYIKTHRDIEAIEAVPDRERFPVSSPGVMLDTMAQQQGDDIALTYLPTGSIQDEPMHWTYKQYRQQVVAAANLFRTLGVEDNQSVAFLLPNRPETLFGFFGAQRAAIAIPINPFLLAEQITDIVREAESRIIVTLAPEAAEDNAYLQKALLVQQSVPSVQHIIVVGGEGDVSGEGLIDWASAIAAQEQDHLIFDRAITGNEISTYFHTGGTTGTPKLAQQTHRAQAVNVCQLQMTTPVFPKTEQQARTVILNGLPLFHVGGVFVNILNAIQCGGTLVLAGPNGFRNKTLIKDFWRLVERYRVSFFAAVPTIYAALMEEPTDRIDTSSLVYCICGAAPVSEDILKDFQTRTGADIVESYGMTEVNCVASVQYYHSPRRLGAIGMRVPYHKVRIVALDSEGGIARDCAVNEIGVLLHHGPNVIPSYKQESANRDAWPAPGWLNSGDVGRMDEDGYIWLTGRAKDLIIRGGHNIDPRITENALLKHPAVMLAAAVGKPDSYAGELPVAYVQLQPGAEVDAETLMAFARAGITERAAAPVEVFIWPALPLTAVGKIFKPDLLQDAIIHAYRSLSRDVIPDIAMTITVDKDKTHGLRVVLSGVLPDGFSDNDVASCYDRLAEKYRLLTYVWTLSLQCRI